MRSLLGFFGLAILLAAAGAGCSTAPPGASLQATIAAANSGDMGQANEGLSAKVRTEIEKTGEINVHWDRITHQRTVTKLTVEKEEIKGPEATVHYSIYYKDGRSDKHSERMVLEGGKWRIASFRVYDLGKKDP